MRQELSSHPLQDIVHFVRSQAIATFQDACKLRQAFTVALSAVFGYIGPFWQILDSRASDGRLDDAHLSQDILPASAPRVMVIIAVASSNSNTGLPGQPSS